MALRHYTPEKVQMPLDVYDKSIVALLTGTYRERREPYSSGTFVVPSDATIFWDFNSFAKHDTPKWTATFCNERIVGLDISLKLADLCHTFGDLYNPWLNEVFTVRPKKDIPENACFYYYVPKDVQLRGDDDDDAFYVGYRGSQCACCNPWCNTFVKKIGRAPPFSFQNLYFYHPASKCAYTNQIETIRRGVGRFCDAAIGWMNPDQTLDWTPADCNNMHINPHVDPIVVARIDELRKKVIKID